MINTAKQLKDLIRNLSKRNQQSIIMTLGAIILIVIIGAGYGIINKNNNEYAGKTNENSTTDILVEELNAEEQLIKEDIEVDSIHPTFTPQEEYDYSFMDKSAEELHEEMFSVTEQETEYVHFYIENGTLYLDEYANTGKQDEEGVYIYEWNNGQKIDENVIFVDYNWYRMEPNALYITEDHVLHGTGDYKDISLKNIKFADVYADQMLALTLDGNLWCRGLARSISDGRTLEYPGWELVMQDVAYAHLAHYRYMAITNDGALYMWGDNTYGQFGDGSLLKDGSQFKTDCYFYPEPVKVADDIKMVWEGHPGKPKQTEEIGECRTYFLTTDDMLFVSGEMVGDEVRSYSYFGEMGNLEKPLKVNCTSKLHKVITE